MQAVDKILLIDDDPISSIILEKVNAYVNFAMEVVSRYSAVDGLDYLLTLEERGESAPEVIFLDICMPIVNGWQFLEQFKTLETPGLQHTKIFMLATSSDQSDINRAKKFDSVEDYIAKPLTADRLSAIQAKFHAIAETSDA